MPLHAQPLLFEFELSSSENLTYIPMCVRFNLDRCGVRLTLLQWQALPHAERLALAAYPLTGSCDAVDGFSSLLAAWLDAAKAGELAPVVDAPEPVWTCIERAPAVLSQQCALHQLAPITDAVWGRLPELQRYVLAKLSRRASANHDFLAALREFGLLAAG